MFKFLSLFGLMDEAGADGAQGGGTPAATAQHAEPSQTAAPAATKEPAKPAEPSKEPAAEELEATPEPEAHPMDAVIERHQSNPAVSLALGFLKDNGISPEDPAFQMAEMDGDFSLLEATLATKGTPGADKVLDILKGAVEDYQKQVVQQYEQTEGFLTDILGDTKEEAFEWVRSVAEPEEQKMLNEMLDCGGIAAMGAALALRELYAKAGNTVQAKTVRTPNASTASGALSRSDFTAAVNKMARGNPDYRNTPQYQSLWQRRQAGMKQGI